MADSRLKPSEVRGWTFSTGFRGFDQAEVRRALDACASALDQATERIHALEAELAHIKAVRADPVLDEAALMAALGDEASRVLLAAKEAAADIRSKAEANAAAALEASHVEAEAIRATAHAEAERLTHAAETVLAGRTAEAELMAQRITDEAHARAEEVKAAALAEARAMVAEAREVRERMLEDLRRRKARGEEQLGILRAGRDRLLEAYGVVRDTMDEATEALATAEARARADAEPADVDDPGDRAEAAGVAGVAARDRGEPAAAGAGAATAGATGQVPVAGPAAELARAPGADQPHAAGAAEPAQPVASAAAAAVPDDAHDAHDAATVEPDGAADPADLEVARAAGAPPVTDGDAGDGPPTGEVPAAADPPTGPMAAVVPFAAPGPAAGAVAADEAAEPVEPVVVDPPSTTEAPRTGEVPAIAATGTDNAVGDRRRRLGRRSLRLADDPAVRAEEARLASMRLLHQPRRGDEPEVHLPEDGMVVVEPTPEVDQVRVVTDPGGAETGRSADLDRDPEADADVTEAAAGVTGAGEVTDRAAPPPEPAGTPWAPPAAPGEASPSAGDPQATAERAAGRGGASALAAALAASSGRAPAAGAPSDDPPAGDPPADDAGRTAAAAEPADPAGEAVPAARQATYDPGEVAGGTGPAGGRVQVPQPAGPEPAAAGPDPEPASADGSDASGDGGDGGDGGERARDDRVDALFARLRAGRQDASAAAHQVLSAGDPGPPAAGGPAPEPAPAPAAATSQPAPVQPVEAPAVAVDDESLLQARDAATGPVEADLARRVKRLLQDHQNEVLDQLRGRKRPTALEVLGRVEDLVAPLAAAAGPFLDQAAAAGADASPGPGAAPRTDDLARDVAANVVRDLRPRLEVVLADAGGGPVPDDPGVLDRINAAFREWRGERVARLVGDAVHAAYSRGFFVATPSRTSLRWVVDDGDTQCPDCEDNGLAGWQRKGEPFPTGQRHPPAHSGCRCLLTSS